MSLDCAIAGNDPQVDANTFVIDSKHLDSEWERQSSLCFGACSDAAKAYMNLSDMKRLLDVTIAEVGISIRQNPTGYGLKEKPTEGAIATAVTLDDRVVDMQRRVVQAKYQYDMCQAAVTALENKKKGLESLTQLRMMNYYSSK